MDFQLFAALTDAKPAMVSESPAEAVCRSHLAVESRGPWSVALHATWATPRFSKPRCEIMKIHRFFMEIYRFSCKLHEKSWISTISQRLLGDRVVSHLVHPRAQVLGLPKVQSFADAHEVSRFLGSSGCRSHPHTPGSREWLPLGPHITLGGGFDNSQISQESLGNHENP